MPIKEFECQACKHKFEDILGLHDPVPTVCPKCGGGPLKQLLGTFRIGGVTRKSASEDDAGEGGDAPPDGDWGAGLDGGADGGDSFPAGDETPGDAGDDMTAGADGDDAGGGDFNDEEAGK